MYYKSMTTGKEYKLIKTVYNEKLYQTDYYLRKDDSDFTAIYNQRELKEIFVKPGSTR